MLWMYSNDFPAGKLFASMDEVPAGWTDSPANLGATVPELDLDAMDKSELLAFADGANIAVDARWGRERLLKAVKDGDGS